MLVVICWSILEVDEELACNHVCCSLSWEQCDVARVTVLLSFMFSILVTPWQVVLKDRPLCNSKERLSTRSGLPMLQELLFLGRYKLELVSPLQFQLRNLVLKEFGVVQLHCFKLRFSDE